MKRFLSLIIVIVMMSGCVISVAEEQETAKDEYLRSLQIQSLIYELMPDEFGSDQIMYSYLLYMLYLNSEMKEMYELNYAISKAKENRDTVSSMKDYALAGAKLSAVITEGFENWLNGKMTDQQYSEILMEFINTIIEREK